MVAIDFLTGRTSYPDEVIEVLDHIEAPLDVLGRFHACPPPLMITDAARQQMLTAASELRPNETGGILVGARDATGVCCVTAAIELRPEEPSPARYEVPAGATHQAVDTARAADDRLEYLGEWHSHPSDQSASSTDARTMTELATAVGMRDPYLLIVRPVDAVRFEIDAFLATVAGLVKADLVAVGPLPSRTS